MPEKTAPRLATLPMLADHLGEPLHRLEYVVRTRSIEPRVRLMATRMYHRDQLPDIRAALAETAKSPKSKRRHRQELDALADELLIDDEVLADA